MNYVIIGCGRVGAELGIRLTERGYRVAVVDERAESFQTLPHDFRGRQVEGDVLSQKVLERAGIETADGLAAVTNSDAVNAVVARVARIVYGVRQVLVRNYDPRWRVLHETFGIQAVSSSSWGAQRMEELLELGGRQPLLSAGNGEIQIFEVTVPERWSGRKLPEVLPERDCLAVALTRGGRAALPAPDAELASGDIVHVAATAAGFRELQRRLKAGEEL